MNIMTGLSKIVFWTTIASYSFFLTNKASSRDLADFTIGINTHRVFAKDTPILEVLGVSSPRVDHKWSEISFPNGVVNPNHSNLTSLLNSPISINNTLGILDYGHPGFDNGGRIVSPEARQAYVSYSLDTIKALWPKDHSYEIWNEWVNERGKPEDYFPLMLETYTAIKADFPSATVLGGATTGIGEGGQFLKKILDAGALSYMDGLVIHPYIYRCRDDARLPESGLRTHLQNLYALLANYPCGDKIPIYVTEIGWPTYTFEGGVTDEEQAKYISRSIFLFAIEPRIKGVWLYELRDGGVNPTDPQDHFGILNRDYSPKPAFGAFKDSIRLLKEAQSIENIPNDSDDQIRTMKLLYADKSVAWLAWSKKPEKKWKIEYTSGDQNKAKPLKVGFPDQDKLVANWDATAKVASLEIDDVPTIIHGFKEDSKILSLIPKID